MKCQDMNELRYVVDAVKLLKAVTGYDGATYRICKVPLD